MAKRILLILGHPDAESFCAALADAYAEAADEAGAELRMLRLGELAFDPVLHHGYRQIQPLEPDLQAAQQDILWAQHLVFVYPNWWGSMPALMKGFIDRAILPGFAFKYRKDSLLWDKLLTGRSADVFVTMDTPPWYYRWVYRMPGHNQIRRTILGFTGIKPVRVHSFGPVKTANAVRREKWLMQVRRAARRAAV